jgi:glycosyltransferase involved in cell wall biosynthesis
LTIIGKLNESQVRELELSGIDYENKTNLSASQIITEYENCDIVGFASLYEGFGMPIIEAQRVGRPVVTSNCSSMPEVAGNGACLVDPLDVSSIRAGIQRVIEDQAFRESLVTNGFKNARRFEPDVIARQYLELYRSVFAHSLDD